MNHFEYNIKQLLAILMFALLPLMASCQAEVPIIWEASTDNVGVEGYNVWLNDELYETVTDTFTTLYLEVGEFICQVSAFDAAGNESERSNTLHLRITDIIRPSKIDTLRERDP